MTNPFNHLRLKYKLALAFILMVIPLLIIAGISSYLYLKAAFIQSTKSELESNAAALVKMVDTAASVAIKNYLRSVADTNRQLLNALFDTHQKGEISWTQMRQSARNLLQTQIIGKTGYIYCLNSQGTLELHPSQEMLGKNIASYDFIKQQINRKQGYLEYLWKNPHEPSERPKALYMFYFEPLDWIVSVSSYREEFHQLIDINDISDNVRTLQFGDSGHAFLLDQRSGDLLIHSKQDHSSKPTQPMLDADQLMAAIATQPRGNITYRLQVPQTGATREILTYFDTVEAFGWIVCTSYFVDDLFRSLTLYRWLIFLTIILILGISMGIAFWFSAHINYHIQRLIEAFEKGKKGSLSVRLTPHGNDELGMLAHYFNGFMQRLENFQQHLFRSERKYRRLYQGSLDGYVMVDADLNIIEHNSAFSEMLGYDETDLIGRPIHILLPKTMSAAETPFSGHSNDVLRENSDLLEMDFITRDGLVLPVELRIHTLRNEEGAPTAYWSFARDISKRIAAEQERRKLVMAIEQVADIIIITDTQGRIEYVNPAFEKSSGYSRSEAIGRTPSILKSGKHDEAFYHNLWDTIRNGDVWSGRLINRKKDDSLFYEYAVISPMRNEAQTIVNYVASKRDITNEVLLESQLRQTDRINAIGTLAGGIAHDFNNILSGIMGYTEISKYETESGSKLYTRLDKILSACQRASELIRHIQTFSRKTSSDPIPMLPGPLVKEAVKLIQASYSGKIKVDCWVEDVGGIRAVPAQIHQIVMNLCTNACEAMGDQGGVLTVALEKQYMDADSARSLLNLSPGYYVKLTVSDTGPGIAPEIIDSIFDPYFTTKEEKEGTGLGLSVVHGIVAEMEGAIWGCNQPSGGAAVVVCLPAPDAKEESGVKPSLKAPLGNGQSVLVVDSEENVLQVTKEILESLNYRVETKISATEALNIISSQPQQFDLVMCDAASRPMDGFKFATALKKIRKEIPMVISTGFSDSEGATAAKITGLARLINKPIIRSDLARLMAKCLRQNSA